MIGFIGTSITSSLNHTLNLPRPTSNSSSTTNFPWLSFTANCLKLWTNTSYRLSLYRLRTDPTESTACIVEEPCLQLRCLAIDVLLLSAIMCWGDMFRGPLPRNELQRCIHYCCPYSLLRECLRSRYLTTMAFLYLYRNGPYITILFLLKKISCSLYGKSPCYHKLEKATMKSDSFKWLNFIGDSLKSQPQFFLNSHIRLRKQIPLSFSLQ
jgi:hypothetical protein